MKNYLALLLLFLSGGSVVMTGDSTRYLLPEDTIFLQIGKYQHKIFEHEIEKGQTLYSLAKFYGLSIDELYLYNPQLLDRVLSPYEKVSIPIPNRAISAIPRRISNASSTFPSTTSSAKAIPSLASVRDCLKCPWIPLPCATI